MTKIYLVCRRFTEKKDGKTQVKVSVTEVFTNKKKALALVRWYKAVDKLDKINYPILTSEYNPEIFIDERTICNMDYTEYAIQREMELLPY